jgi:hypothetical protein
MTVQAQPEGALRASGELCEMRKQGRIFTTENTEEEDRGGTTEYRIINA